MGELREWWGRCWKRKGHCWGGGGIRRGNFGNCYEGGKIVRERGEFGCISHTVYKFNENYYFPGR